MEQLKSGHSFDFGGADGCAKILYKIAAGLEGDKVTVRNSEGGCGACRINYRKVLFEVDPQTHLFGSCLLLGLREASLNGL